jgi:hypothetical protein
MDMVGFGGGTVIIEGERGDLVKKNSVLVHN